MRVSIIGCGYIGKRLARQLQEQSIAVSGVVSSEASLEECAARSIPCILVDLDMPGHQLDVAGRRLIYLAPPPSAGREDTRLGHCLDSLSHPPEKFVLISTTGVYGDCGGAWVDETAPVRPAADRAFRRADAEARAQSYCSAHGVPLVILRVPGIYGPGKIPLARIRSGEPIVRSEDSPWTNRIHADDLVNICEKALLDMNISGTYNASDGHPGTMHEYFTGLARALDLPEPPSISLEEARSRLSAGMLSYMAESRRIDNSKLLKDFGIQLRYPDLASGLSCIVES